MINGTVDKIEGRNKQFDVTAGSQAFRHFDVMVGTKTYRARKVVLGTGLVDLLPSTPGVMENWGKGIYWCPWCDGYERKDQPLGLIGKLQDIPGLFREIRTLNKDVVAFVNGSDTPEMRAETDAKNMGWKSWLSMHNVRLDNRTIKSITRLSDSRVEDQDPNLPTTPEYDSFKVNFYEGKSIKRNALLVDFPSKQRSPLGSALGVESRGNKLFADSAKGFESNIPGVYVIGDANSDNSTNVPHALYSGKRAAVYIHGEYIPDTLQYIEKKKRSLRLTLNSKDGARRYFKKGNGRSVKTHS